MKCKICYQHNVTRLTARGMGFYETPICEYCRPYAERYAAAIGKHVALLVGDDFAGVARFRLTPHPADAACAPAGNGDGETRGAADV